MTSGVVSILQDKGYFGDLFRNRFVLKIWWKGASVKPLSFMWNHSYRFCQLLSPVASSHCTSPKVKPGNYSMHLSKLLNKHKTIETRALDVNSSLLEMDANKPNDDYKNGYKTQISTQVGNMDIIKKVKQQLLGDWSSRRRDGNVGQSETFGPNWNV